MTVSSEYFYLEIKSFLKIFQDIKHRNGPKPSWWEAQNMKEYSLASHGKCFSKVNLNVNWENKDTVKVQ